MKKEIAGKVTETERDEIERLYKRKLSLESLIKSVNPEDENGKQLYEKIVSDMEDVSYKFSKWWPEKAQKYGWKNVPGGRWEMNFDTGEVMLVY